MRKNLDILIVINSTSKKATLVILHKEVAFFVLLFLIYKPIQSNDIIIDQCILHY
jgi:hypothetical protein